MFTVGSRRIVISFQSIGQSSFKLTSSIRAPRVSTRQYRSPPAPEVIETISIGSNTYRKDEWTNVSPNLINAVHRKLHLQSNHPLAITREIIESRFPDPIYKYHNNLFPVVSTVQNFDSLGFPEDHPGRSRKDTYYVNKETVLRTHTSAHEADVFRANKSAGYLISADVYRRDAIDRSHYPIFHQMEGARMWSRKEVPGGDIAKAVMEDFKTLPTHDINIEDPNPTIHPERNPLQSDYHSAKEVEAISKHLKRSLENVVIEIFSRARVAAQGDSKSATAPIQIRWIEAYFPHTSPSWELEVFWEGDWLELLGCGVVKQELLIDAGVPDQLGWAFGLGLERIAMLLFNIPDIRLFWSQDDRFLSQFSSSGPLPRFIPFSKHPACYKDVAFWLRSSSSSAGGGLSSDTQDFHENDVMEVVRDVAGDSAEDVRLVDQFIHPSTSRRSLCYRINYRSLDKTLTNTEANQLHEEVRKSLVERLGVELR